MKNLYFWPNLGNSGFRGVDRIIYNFGPAIKSGSGSHSFGFILFNKRADLIAI